MKRPIFYVGLHQPSDASQFDRSMVSLNRLEDRKRDFCPREWILDSGAFTRIERGVGHMEVQDYAKQIHRWARCGNLVAAVSQDYMCEPYILGITGSTVAEHQRLTTQRYRLLHSWAGGTYIMPVLQGYTPGEYQAHIADYGDDLEDGAWVGVGSVCKRNGSPRQVEALLLAIADVRPDLRLHGFGLKRTALQSHLVNELLYSCDSMAWSLAARRAGRNANDPAEAHRYAAQLAVMPVQGGLFVGTRS